jgi:hypothetical protein
MSDHEPLDTVRRIEVARSHAAIGAALDDMPRASVTFGPGFLGQVINAMSEAHARLRDINATSNEWSDSQIIAACESLGRVVMSELEAHHLMRLAGTAIRVDDQDAGRPAPELGW